MFRPLLILVGIPSPGQLLMPALTLAANMNFPLLLKFNQSNKQNFDQGIRPPTIMGWIYVVNRDYGNLSLKALLCWEQLNHTKDNQSSSSMLGTI